MEDVGICRVKKSLGFFLGLIWTFGIPDLGVRYIWRLTYGLIVSLLFSAIYGISLSKMFASRFSLQVNDAGAQLSAELFACIYTYAITIVWATRGAKIVQKTIMNLAKVDVVMEDFQDIKNNFTLRQSQVFWIGFFFLWCSTEATVNLLADHSQSYKISLAVTAGHHFVHWICSIASSLHILTFNILFSSIIFAIRQRFQRVNTALYKMGNARDLTNKISTERRVKYILVHNNRPKMMKSRMEKIIDELDLLCKMHKHLRDITEEFNGVFSVALFLVFLSGLTSSLAYAYIMSVTAHMSPHNETIFLMRGFTLFYSFVRFRFLIQSCSGLVTEANKLGVLLHRINVTGEVFYRKLRELSVKHHQEKLKIVAGGVLPIEYSCLKIVFSTVAAYTLLIFQQGVE